MIQVSRKQIVAAAAVVVVALGSFYGWTMLRH
ncbi:secretion protein HlyD, partial [Burkholderia pseudomallei]